VCTCNEARFYFPAVDQQEVRTGFNQLRASPVTVTRGSCAADINVHHGSIYVTA
jgi:hypothetical protein